VLKVRSILFNLVFYLNLALLLIVTVPALLMTRHQVIAMAKLWARSSLWLLRVICDVRVEWRGLEKVPSGKLIVASKHQSLWETFALISVFPDPTFIVKRELMWLPFFGWCMWKAGIIPVDRGARSVALAAMTKLAKVELDRGRQLIIFPEGTRRAPGAEPAYKYGVAHLYVETGAPCLPIALNSGLVWPRRSFMRYPGTVRVEMLDVIEPGIPRQAFFERLQSEIEAATARLIGEREREPERQTG